MSLKYVLQVTPFAKTGGLADVCGSLPPALAARGHRVMVVTPRYAEYETVEYSGVCVRVMDTEVGYHTLKRNGVDFVFVDNPCYPRVGELDFHPRRLDH